MKYLKYFNESISDHIYHIRAIKDVFQDLIDEFDLENATLSNRPLPDGMYYSIQKMNNVKREGHILFSIQMIYDHPLDPNVKLLSKKLKDINDSLEPYISRLKRMGYNVDVKKYSNLTDIQIDFSNLIVESKDSKYEIDIIRDIFSDVVDTFGLYEYDPNIQAKGLLYYIRGRDEEDDAINVWISDFTTSSMKIPDEIYNSVELKGFEKRLKNMGYDVEDVRPDKTEQYYHIRVSK